ncbi:unnamed protein product [Chrysoparadoxa australica]
MVEVLQAGNKELEAAEADRSAAMALLRVAPHVEEGGEAAVKEAALALAETQAPFYGTAARKQPDPSPRCGAALGNVENDTPSDGHTSATSTASPSSSPLPRKRSDSLHSLANLATLELNAMRDASPVGQRPCHDVQDEQEVARPRYARPRSQSNPEGMDLEGLHLSSCRPSSVRSSGMRNEFSSPRSSGSGSSSPFMFESIKEEEGGLRHFKPPDDGVTQEAWKQSDALPHTLSKYAEFYNKSGRIGIYTKAERAAIIARFHEKRSRRVWRKKIRYNCRKNLADKRRRVKGRFVRLTAEQKTEEPFEQQQQQTIAAVGAEVRAEPTVEPPSAEEREALAAAELDGTDGDVPPPGRRMRRHSIAF